MMKKKTSNDIQLFLLHIIIIGTTLYMHNYKLLIQRKYCTQATHAARKLRLYYSYKERVSSFLKFSKVHLRRFNRKTDSYGNYPRGSFFKINANYNAILNNV